MKTILMSLMLLGQILCTSISFYFVSLFLFGLILNSIYRMKTYPKGLDRNEI